METKESVAGIDVHKQMLAVVVGSAGESERQWQRRKFGTTVKELRPLNVWLQDRQVKEVAMESTAQYGKPVWIALEADFRLNLAQARSNKAPKGRKGDYRDGVRLVKRLLADDLTLSYVPDAEQRRWRSLTRGKHQLTRERVRLQSQIECLLEAGQIQLYRPGIFFVAPMTPAMYQMAQSLSRKHTATLGTRTLDILHVASALVLEAESFYTFDRRQAETVRATGMKMPVRIP